MSSDPSATARERRVSTKLAAFTLLLVAVFGVGAAIGAAFGPSPDDEPTPSTTAVHEGHG